MKPFGNKNRQYFFPVVCLLVTGILAGCSSKDYNPPYQNPTILKIAVSGTIQGDSVAEAGSQVSYGTYTLQSSPGYTWTVPSDATIISGAGSNAITVQFGLDTGVVKVVSGNMTGQVTLKIPFDVSGPSTASVGSAVSYQSTASPLSGVVYQWTVPSDATIVSGVGTNQISVIFASAGNASVTCQASSSTVTRSSTLAVTVN